MVLILEPGASVTSVTLTADGVETAASITTVDPKLPSGRMIVMTTLSDGVEQARISVIDAGGKKLTTDLRVESPDTVLPSGVQEAPPAALFYPWAPKELAAEIGVSAASDGANP